ncbi:hypothetical protein CPLU01_04346 [Colletotrichum plurivorum]|uniref:Uncharacterized protein n=1 Tax=Colletotrichum plurivorum TaxID=2175906 RepID=A0A8H6NK18_9PEZI|nr:hypothetical protein CPLU01_04346 [Colletotrichum plurivorum]
MKKKSMSNLASSLATRRRDRGNRIHISEPRGKNRKHAHSRSVLSDTSRTDIAPDCVRLPVPAENYHVDAPRDTVPRSETVDRLANDLLESTIFSHPNGLASHPSVLLCATEPLSAAQSTPDLNMTVDVPGPVQVPGPFAAHRSTPSPAETAPSTSDTIGYTQAVGIAPAIPRKSSRRRGKRAKMVNVDAPDVESHASQRSLPQSKTTMLDGGRKQDVFLPGSTTAPLGALGTQFDGRMPTPTSNMASPTTINDKVTAMLAATEALKPRGSQVITPVSSKPSRSKAKKVMSKMRQAFEMFQPKPATPESNIRGKISAPVGLTTCDLPNPASHYHLEEVEKISPKASPVSSLNIRLNEGINLNNSKVRSIVGGCIVRKPVRGGGRSLRSGGSGSSDDPFCEYEVIRSPTPFEHKLKSSLDSTGVPPVPPLNYGIDDDLEGLLPERPLCASTPRNRLDRKAVTRGSPSYRYAKANDHHLMMAKESENVPAGSAKPKLKLDVERARLYHDGQDATTKKHPSPSKEDLSDLETNFRAYAIEQIKKAPSEQRDELVTKFAGLIGPNALTPRDKNVPMKTRSAKEDTIDDVSSASERRYTRDGPSLPTTHSRIPRPVEATVRVRPTPRYGLQRLPSNPDALETDELQWDVAGSNARF